MKKYCFAIICLALPFMVFSQSSNNDKKISKNSELVLSVEINDSLNNNRIIQEIETPLMLIKKSDGNNPNLPKEDISTPLMRVIVKKENEEVSE